MLIRAKRDTLDPHLLEVREYIHEYYLYVLIHWLKLAALLKS